LQSHKRLLIIDSRVSLAVGTHWQSFYRLVMTPPMGNDSDVLSTKRH